MRAKEIMGNVDENGQISLDTPLTVDKHTSLQEAKAGKTRQVSELWNGIDGE